MHGNKPDWKYAPEWAKYLAMDEDGSWFWYENEPKKYCDGFDTTKGRVSGAGDRLISWEYSLEERPE